MTSDPDNNIFSAELHCRVTACFFFLSMFFTTSPTEEFFFCCCFFKLRSSEWRMGVPSVYPPPPRQSHLLLTYSRLRGAFVLCWRKCIVCPSAPLHLPPSRPAPLFGLKRPTADVGGQQHQQRGGGGGGGFAFFARAIVHVLGRRTQIFVCGGTPAIYRCANISF